MERKEFIKKTCLACVGFSALNTLLYNCSPINYIDVSIENNYIIIPLSEFDNKNKKTNYIIAHNNNLASPILIYYKSESEYSAIDMICTHQGIELTAYGEKLVCSAHGSEFDYYGNVTNGPATRSLYKFDTKIENQKIIISLKNK